MTQYPSAQYPFRAVINGRDAVVYENSIEYTDSASTPETTEQLTLGAVVEAAAPHAIAEFLSGFASYYAFGDKPTAAQKRQAARVGAELAGRLAWLRISGT